MSSESVTARFDWYAATIREDPDTLLRVFAHELGGEVVGGTARNGYATANHIRVKDSNVLTMFSGGRNGNPHVFASSDDTDAFVQLVRSLGDDGAPRFPHHVTRMDTALDFDGPGTWDRLYEIALRLALNVEPDPDDLRRNPREVSLSQAGDWIRPVAGRTLYLGSKSSAVIVRLYEKGKQLKGLALDGGPEISEDLVRLEVQVRPDGDARHRAARCDPLDAFGYADWTKELLRRVQGANVERVHIRERRESDHERAMYWLVRQYGAHLLDELALLGGSPADLGQELVDRIARYQGEVPEPLPDDVPWRGFDNFMKPPTDSTPF